MPGIPHTLRKSFRSVLTLLVALAMLLAYGVVIDPEPASATSTTVGTQAEYVDALDDLSTDPSGPHTITLLNDITFTTSDVPAYEGTEDLVIDGDGYTMHVGYQSQALYSTTSTATITFEDITITEARGHNGGIDVAAADIELVDAALYDFRGSNDAGGIGAGSGDVTLIRSIVDGATAGDDAGGIFGQFVTLIDSTVSNNTARGSCYGEGGGVYAPAGALVVNSTITGNTANGACGGAYGGGGIYSSGPVTLIHATVAGNSTSAPNYGGANISIRTGSMDSFGSVVANPTGAPNCVLTDSAATTSSYSYDDDGSCGFTGTGDTSNGADPLLMALADNGGPTPTMLPADGSPLLDAIPAGSCDTTYTADQRGIDRPQGFGCDIGSVEVEVEIPFVTYDLIADGPDTDFTEDIGDVRVWNDCDTLYVEVETTDGWEFYEAHVHATTEEVGEFPVTKKGSPKVGQFFYNRSYDPWETMDTFEFDLDSETELEIAVHLSVWDTNEKTISFVSDPSDAAYGPSYASGGPFAATETLVIDTPNAAWAPAASGASWLTLLLDQPEQQRDVDEWATFTETFELPDQFVLVDAELVANSDNAEAVFVNGIPATATSGQQGDVYGPVGEVDKGAFGYPSDYPLDPQPGSNTIEFLVRNYAGPNVNPMAVNWAGTIEYLDRNESAWGYGDFFRSRGDWSMYFEYTILVCEN